MARPRRPAPRYPSHSLWRDCTPRLNTPARRAAADAQDHAREPVVTTPASLRAAPAVSVVVPAFNEEHGLAASLHAIRGAMSAFAARGWRTELIVCDNNSTDRTAAVAAAAGARVVFEPINQISRARNTWAAHATGEWLIFVDADSHPSQALFFDVADAIESGTLLAAGSTIRMAAAHPGVRVGVGLWNLTSRLTRWAAGSFIVCDRAAFVSLGGFSLDLFAAEELDLFRRLKRVARRSGQRIVILRRHPLLTSDRKMRLYSWREMLGFNLRTILSRGRPLRSARDAFIWYDGRREPPPPRQLPPDTGPH